MEAVQQLQQCVSVFLELGELIRSERRDEDLRTFYRGRTDISEAILALNTVLTGSRRWSVGRLVRARRHDGKLDLALVVELVQGVSEADNEQDQTVHARICWLRPRSHRELVSRGFLVPFEQLLLADGTWEAEEQKALEKATHAWVMGFQGFLQKSELLSFTGGSLECDDKKWGRRTVVRSTLAVCPCSSEPIGHTTSGADQSEEAGEEPIPLLDQMDQSAAIGAWERHTRGFGSKMLLKMGYHG